MSTDATIGDRSTISSKSAEEIVVSIRLEHSRLLCGETIRRVPDVTIRPEYTTMTASGDRIAYVAAFGDSFEAFESALEFDETVRNGRLCTQYSDRRVYRLALTNDVIRLTPAIAEVGGRVICSRTDRGVWEITIGFPSRDALGDFAEDCRERDVTVNVTHLRCSSEEADRLVSLTAKQQTLLSIAYEEGYFDVPRGISQDELAEAVGVSTSAVSQRLRRALSQLCASSIGVKSVD